MGVCVEQARREGAMVAAMKPGPVGRPEQVLRDAAIDYAADVEAGCKAGWDKLRQAAIRYVEAEKHKGRPRGQR